MNQPIQLVQPHIEKEETIDLAKHLGFLLDNRWLIAGVALAVTLLGAAYAFIAKPIYESDILIQVEDIPGSASNILGELSTAFDLKTAAASEMEILRSRMVVSHAVDNLRLYIRVQPKYFPVIGAWIARRNQRLSEPGLFGAGGYAWGSEQAVVSVFNVPEELEGEEFVLTAEADGRFVLMHDERWIEARGRVGDAVRARTPHGDIELRVDRIDAKPGAKFLLVRESRLTIVEKLQDMLRISEKGKQSGIIGVTLNGPNPKTDTAILNEIGHEYIRQNVDRKSEEAKKSLAFLNRQLPELKQELERSESAYNTLRNNRGTIDLGEEARTILQQSVSNQSRLVELKQRREDLLARFQEAHPAVEAIDRQMQSLSRELASVDTKIRKLPAVEQDVLRLTRDVKVNTDMYTGLLKSAQQLRLATESRVGNARLLDIAEKPIKPVKPRRLMVISMAAMIGLVLGALAAFARKTFYGRIDDPHDIRKSLGLTVSVTIPHSASQEQLYAQIQNRSRAVSVLAHDAPTDSAIESLRGFRASLQYAMRASRNNIIAITSATPEVGKSFVSANLAVVLASVGKQVLLVDGDLRRGYLHRYFGLERSGGLSELISGRIALDQAVHKSVVENVDFISTGDLPPKPAELLAHENFGELLQRLAARYDYVLIDTAPVLAVSDALTVGPYAGVMFNIVRGGVSTLGEVEETVKRLNQAGATVTGTVFNDSKSRSARYGYGPQYAKYRYAECK